MYDGRNRQLSPYQGPRRDEVDYASNDFQIKKERNRGRQYCSPLRDFAPPKPLTDYEFFEDLSMRPFDRF